MRFKLTAILVWLVLTTLSSVAQVTPTEVRRLTPGQTIERELKAGQTHAYLITLRQDEFLHVEVDQRGIDVVISLFAPEGTKLAELNNRHIDYGQEALSFAATADGLYRLELKPSSITTMAGRYALRVDQVRGVAASDRVRIEAERAAAEGQRLRMQGKPESYRAALERYELALKNWREIGDHYWEATTLTNIGLIYDALGQKQKALEIYDTARLLCKGLKDLGGEWRIVNNLGAIYQSLGDRRKSLDYATQALVIARNAGDRRSEATTLLNIGNIHAFLSEEQLALDFFGPRLELLRAIGDRAGEADTLIRIGLAHQALGHYQTALDNFNLALPIQQATGNKSGQAEALMRMGDVYSALGDKQKALDSFNQALALKHAAGDIAGEGEVLDFIGQVYSSLGEKGKALDNFKRAVQLRHQAEDRTGEAFSLVSIAMVYSDLGQDRKALEYYDQALSLRRVTEDPGGEVLVLNLIGFTYRKLGDNQKALEYHNKALPLTRGANGDLVREADTLTDIANVYYSLGDRQKALDFHQQALPLIRAVGRRRIESYALAKIGLIYSDLGEKRKALDYYNASLQLSRAIFDKSAEAGTLSRLGNLYRDLGETTKALDYYNSALLLSRAVGDRSGEALTFINLMLMEGALKNHPLAIFFGKQAISIYQDLRSNIQGLEPDVQQTFLHSIEIWYRTLADLLISEGRLPEARQILGMLKEEEYFDFVRRDASEVAALTQRADLTAQEQKVFADYTQLAGNIAAIGNKQSAFKAKLKALPEGTSLPVAEQAEYERLTAQLDTANKAFTLFLERMTGEFSKAQQSDIRENRGLQRDLKGWGAGTVALYTIVGEDRYRVILTTANTQVDGKTEIRAAELNQKVLAFREAVQNPNVDPRPLAQELYNILIKPIEKQLEGAEAKTLVWSLDGTLRYLPLAALFDGKQYLAEKYQQVIITLASRTRLSEPVNHNWRGLGLGVSQAGAVSAPGSTRRMGFKALPGVPAELRAIIRDENLSAGSPGAGDGLGVLPGKRLLDKEFTARAFADALGRSYSLVHIASHFSFIPGNADQSFLLLGDSTALTLESLRTSDDYDFKGVELLTLSACNTGVGTTGADGKEVEGFGAVAQERGAKAVLATLWPVADESTRELMARFYRNYEATPNISKAEALRQAQISLLRGEQGGGPGPSDRRSTETVVEAGKPELPLYKTDPHAPFSHPYYWAPFILIGNWR